MNANTPAWQPIETAPKDGTAVWVSNGFSMRVALWASGKEFEHLGSIGGGWRDFFEACHPNRMADLMFTPAYWQALPKSPHRLAESKAPAVTEVIEHVARALARVHFERKVHVGFCTKEARVDYMVNTYWRNHVTDARAAIEAMRVVPDRCYDDYRCDKPWSQLNSGEVWHLWIDAVLTSGHHSGEKS